MYRLSKITEAIIKERYNKESSKPSDYEKCFESENYIDKVEVLKLLNDFSTLINSHSGDKCLVKVSDDLLKSVKTAMNELMDEHCYLSDSYDVTHEGILQDGAGFIYAGQSNKIYKVGQKLGKKMNDKIHSLIDYRFDDVAPIIMFSRVNKTALDIEHYMFFSTNCDGDYFCFKTSTNMDGELGMAFNNYFYTLLPKPIYLPIDPDYNFIKMTTGEKTRLNNLPMGTVIEMKTGQTFVKASPIGTSACTEIFHGAIDI